MIWLKLVPLGKFQSTPPARGATSCDTAIKGISVFQGGDVRVLDYIGVRYYFNPRPPRGGRLQVDGQMEM